MSLLRHPVGSRVLGLSSGLLLVISATVQGAATRSGPGQGTERKPAAIADTTWADHDRRPIQKPPEWETNYMGTLFRHGFVDPVTHLFDVPDKVLQVADAMGADPQREAVNVNAFDEVPNSSWFTNRNHMKAVPIASMRRGPHEVVLPATPWTIKDAKRGGRTPGFRIKDARGKRWLVKLDPVGHPQMSSGADMISRTLLHAAGYNVPNNQPVQFRRRDLTIDPDLAGGKEGEPFTEADLDAVLAQGAVFPDSSYSAFASLFITGKPLGAPSSDRRRPGDSNDWYSHVHRRELRGLFVLNSWINNWDTKDHQFLDMFVETRDTLGHVEHYLLDVGSSLGASAAGPKAPWWGYEHAVDFGWIGRRIISLGFIAEPWRRASQETGIPEVGNMESDVFEPDDFRTLVQNPAYHRMTDRDGYWGAKIVASFSDGQIAAAVDAAKYREPRAREFLVRNLIVRRDKIARHWFGKVAPLDYFTIEDGALRFHDLAVDVGLEGSRAYDVEVEATPARSPRSRRLRLATTEVRLDDIATGASRLALAISVAGSRAKPTRLQLARQGSRWIVTRVRHG